MLRLALCLLFAGSSLALTACNTSSTGGSPGTTNAFDISGPTLTTTLKQGETKILKITINRRSDFKDAIAFSTSEPSGMIGPCADRL